jgi:hypothetical protein
LIGAEDSTRVRRLKYWITWLTILPGAALLVAGFTKAALGYATGGGVMFLNLLGTERSVLAFLADGSRGRFLVLFLYCAKLALSAAVIAAALITHFASPMALLLGITTFGMALVFDFLFFPRNKRGGEEL